MKILLLCLFLISTASAQTNRATNVPNVDLSTNQFMKIAPLWQPTKGQLACGTNYFTTTVNEFDRVIRHTVHNLESELCLFVTREFTPGGDSTYSVMVMQYSKTSPAYFSPNLPLEFMVDGTRFAFDDEKKILLDPTFNRKLAAYTQSYHVQVSEVFVRALGAASRASMRMPTFAGKRDHDFTPVELRRFKLFVENFLPSDSALKK